MKSVAIITARGGSKRIPRKNIRPFLGKPILEYSIETALQTELFEEVMVSTDDTEIAQIAQQAGAKVPFFRSEETSNDVSPPQRSDSRSFDGVCADREGISGGMLHLSHSTFCDSEYVKYSDAAFWNRSKQTVVIPVVKIFLFHRREVL